ncbi:MAG: RecX family transcriptional regulator [Candidatus Komeilibacteria bacterium]|nr:RecX family transcriptional regulator [Candidatus Komeilibacteria bacterium]
MNDSKLLADPDLKNMYDKMLEYLADGDMAEKRLVNRIERLRLRYPETKRYDRYTSDTAWQLIPLLRENGYINEERYAQRLFDSLKDKKDGLRLIRRKMLRRDIRPEIVGQICSTFEGSGSEQDLSKIVAATTAKFLSLTEKYGSDPIKKYQIRSKIYAWLAMRGYGVEESATIWQKIDFHAKKD